MREYVVENEFVKAVRKAGGVAYKFTSQTANGLPDRLVLFFPAKTIFVELKAPGKQLRPLQRKRRYQLKAIGYAMSGDTRLECMFILYGPTSRNGKGTTMETVLCLLLQSL